MEVGRAGLLGGITLRCANGRRDKSNCNRCQAGKQQYLKKLITSSIETIFLLFRGIKTQNVHEKSKAIYFYRLVLRLTRKFLEKVENWFWSAKSWKILVC